MQPKMTWALLVVIPLVIMLVALLTAGCGRKKPIVVPPVPPDVVENAPAWVDTFLASAKDTVSDVTAGGLSHLHISGLLLLVVAIAARFLFGSWKDAFIVIGLGLLPSAGAVLLADYPRVVLLVPACGVAILIALGAKKIVGWWTGYRAFRKMAEGIEDADTGKNSLGQLVKDKFVELGIDKYIDPALKPLEKEWDKQKTQRLEPVQSS